jgi:hypothetical protein
MIDYTRPADFVLDSLWFSYRGELFKGHGFMEWNPADGFHINALLDKTFAPVDTFKTLGQTIINDKSDAFSIWLRVRGLGSAIAPNVFPLDQKKSLIADNHFSVNLKLQQNGIRSVKGRWKYTPDLGIAMHIPIGLQHPMTLCPKKN